MRPKRLLAILSRYLWPVDGGRKESLNHYFKELHDVYGYEIKLMCFLEYGQSIDKNDFPDYISNVAALKDVSSVEKMKNVLTRSMGKSQWPFQCSFYYSQENNSEIEKVVIEWKPDIIFTEMIRTCVYYNAIKNSGALLLANLDDLLSSRYERQAHSGKSKVSFAGSYSNKMSRYVSKILNVGLIKKVVLSLESNRCAKWEKEYYKLFDYSLMTSDVERDIINNTMVLFQITFHQELYEACKSIANKNGLKLILLIPDVFQASNLDYEGKIVLPSVEEWIGYLENAAYVVTDSFHATVFSIMFERPFSSYAMAGYNGRIYNILNKLDLDKRILLKADISQLEADFEIEIDFNIVKEKFYIWKKESGDWLNKVVEDQK